MVICLEWDADLHTAHMMPVPLTVSCFSKIKIGFTFLVPAHLGSPGKGALNRCVCHLQADCQDRDQLRNATLGNRVWATFLVDAICSKIGLQYKQHVYLTVDFQHTYL